MATFKVGQRVRVDEPRSDIHGKTGAVWAIVSAKWGNDGSGVLHNGDTAYRLDLDGIGREWPTSNAHRRRYYAAPAWALRPLTDPGVDQMIERLTRPVPFIQQLKDMATSGRKVHNEGEKA